MSVANIPPVYGMYPAVSQVEYYSYPQGPQQLHQPPPYTTTYYDYSHSPPQREVQTRPDPNFNPQAGGVPTYQRPSIEVPPPYAYPSPHHTMNQPQLYPRNQVSPQSFAANVRANGNAVLSNSGAFSNSPAYEKASPPHGSSSRQRAQCWDHGCNGREFSTFSNLLRHQREKSGVVAKAECPVCQAVFTRTTARNIHVAQGKCKGESKGDSPEQYAQ